MTGKELNIYVAPMQGYTDAPFRHFHAGVYGAADGYFTPFLRIEHGEVRRRDLRDISSPLNDNHRLVPQVIARDRQEFETLADAVADAGHREIDLNLGCPFPLQTRRGRGAALIANRAVLADIADAMTAKSGIKFSVKMRPGLSSPDEWRQTIDIINEMPLCRLTIHPRLATQQYGGELLMDEFAAMAAASAHPVVYNGDIATPADIDRIASAYPAIEGIMAGRGLLARPSLFAEWQSGREWDADERLAHILRLHTGVYRHYADTLCGDTQILSKIKPFWEYLEPEIGHKPAKAIHKAGSLAKYEAAVASIG